jgi:gamma-glutamyltranspeptidase
VATRFDTAIATAVAVTVVDSAHVLHRIVYQGKDYSHGFLSVPVPSCLKGYEALHKAYGRLPGSKVLQPAVELAENGFVMTKR